MRAALMRLSKCSLIFAFFVIALYIAFAMLARGDEAMIHVLAAECARALVCTMAVSVVSLVLADRI